MMIIHFLNVGFCLAEWGDCPPNLTFYIAVTFIRMSAGEYADYHML